MVGKNSQCVNIDNIKVKVFGEKGEYDLDNLPKLKYKKKDKHRQKRRSKVTGASFSAEVDEPDVHDDTSIDLDQNIGDYETTSAVGTVTPEVVKYTKSDKYLMVTARKLQY
ncbi:Hypothetical predicted protein [Paramuricea clavata]|uniref:Uncharacterized protein n=1 Tax=Paramuricea clavata TaxID=317549 RepID=A0A6S7JG22_PARCT|nr:Hypothetical predicted protein [Paramuricea clavata]